MKVNHKTIKNIPEVRIRFSDLLYFGECQTLAGEAGLDTMEQYEEKTAVRRKEWQKHGDKILNALQDIVGLRFYQPVIDVCCAPYFVPKSSPLIMNLRNEPEEFVDILMHELCHVLLTDNDKLFIDDEKPAINLAASWKKLFGDGHEFDTLVHIPVHALSKYIYLEVLKDSARLDRDIKKSSEWQGAEAYAASWEYVNDHDYQDIIRQLRESYEVIV